MQYGSRWGAWCVIAWFAIWTHPAHAERDGVRTPAAGSAASPYREAVLLASRADDPGRVSVPVATVARSPGLTNNTPAEGEAEPSQAKPRIPSAPNPTEAPPSEETRDRGWPTGEITGREAEQPVLTLTRIDGEDDGAQAAAGPTPRSTTELMPANVAARTALGPRRHFMPSVPNGPDSPPPRTAPDEGNDELDMFILETFAGPSFIAMALGRNDETIAKLQALSQSGLSVETLNGLDPTQLSVGDFVHSVSASGATVGGAASLRLGYLSLGGRLSYSDYDQLSIMTVTGEMAFRASADPVELYLGMGLGSGYLYKVSSLLAKQRDGLAMRVGLGLSFRLTQHVGLGAGVDAVGLFMAGRGINPLQLAQIDEDTDHPIGAQLPFHLDLSVVL